jgi:hypothetical protein
MGPQSIRSAGQRKATRRICRRRTRVAALVAAASATSVLAVVAVASESASDPGTRTLAVASIPTGQSIVDNPPRQRSRVPSASAGDMIVTRYKLLDESNRPGGTGHKVCVFTRGGTERSGRAFFQCDVTLKLPAGDIAGHWAYRGDPINAHIAITGGTRAYQGARGSATPGERKVGRRTLNEVRVHLLP